ncbi:hypothetical protein GUITHDRAFT_157645 [Guillardia theta CCMP2712]|uniref:isoleucine--tRNA ligase n=1 Tax=Guillardia theta (strain CCMP2712) TaxID=905079 RepID=L1JGM6_GUITC|nr:hypothetical protein GUITHDRAFT_157645 [Guillardia theta CCMP2712]EKX47477.1 hypothetical protein GUITHDRAFT_157645 [Guillardia theta CCMP2712]|eukprot:XP_005834457.1 hypothetical protein GUITHDRAFT_157645 [Guillardia theta CCMP2712]
MEEEVLKFWEDIDAFNLSLQKARESNDERWVFFDGPPFATGMPHYGHILAGTIKDIVTRFWSQNGKLVERKWGWDCHGLPIEHEIEKSLGLKSRCEILEMGIPKFNQECRKVVMRYSQEWKRIVKRLARWIDMENDYKTLDFKYMESVWWACKELFKKGLIYRGFKVMPYSTGCGTSLSNFEANLNYKDITDPAVVVSFPLMDDTDVSLLIWTTTPWTLPFNLAICANPDLEYVEIEDKKMKNRYILAKSRLAQLYGKQVENSCKILRSFPGKELEGKEYIPAFECMREYFQLSLLQSFKSSGFRVVTDTFVSSDSGTGLVHTAPGFGEDDFRVCLEKGVVSKSDTSICPFRIFILDVTFRYTAVMETFQGRFVKDCDKDIIQHLRDAGRLVQTNSIVHSYPFCWRSDTPLIYKAVPNWFVNVESIKDKLLANNAKTEWVPSFVKEKRFHNWLEAARDWAISRNRFWGTPLPIWHSEDWEEIVCVGSAEELQRLSNVSLSDLHREFVDEVTIPSSRPGQAPLRRVSEVFDCWFESGCMPYGQLHYPFENVELFEQTFPADFIAEGLDQTRGWFYTLMVLSTALFDKPAFKNVIVNGLVLAADGKKMSKRLKNYPDPEDVINKYGADALRLYLINSPVVRSESLKFKEEGVRDIIKDVFLPWYNAYSNVMDKWIQSTCNSLVAFVTEEMKAYRLYNVVSRLLLFVEDLTNWYVRMNRNRIKGAGNDAQDCLIAQSTLFKVLSTFTQLMAPFTPYISEHIYQNLKSAMSEEVRLQSIHFSRYPQTTSGAENKTLETSILYMQKIIIAGRTVRDKRQISLKTPLRSAHLIVADQEQETFVAPLKSYILSELNLRDLTISREDDDKTCLKALPDSKVLGKRLGSKFRQVAEAIKSMKSEELMRLKREQKIEVCGETIMLEEVKIFREFVGKENKFETTVDEEALEESFARNFICHVQKLKKTSQVSSC